MSVNIICVKLCKYANMEGFVETVTYVRIAIINSPNRRYNPPPAAHYPPTPTP